MAVMGGRGILSKEVAHWPLGLRAGGVLLLASSHVLSFSAYVAMMRWDPSSLSLTTRILVPTCERGSRRSRPCPPL